MTFKYDKPRKTGFEYIFLICGACFVNKDGSDSEDLKFVKTKIDGITVFFNLSADQI